jgi:hypothetical protein
MTATMSAPKFEWGGERLETGRPGFSGAFVDLPASVVLQGLIREVGPDTNRGMGCARGVPMREAP